MKDIAQTLNEKAKNLAADYLRTEGELLLLLIEMRRQRVFPVLNYSGIFDYCERALKLSRAQAYYFKSVAEKSEEVPEIKEAVLQGELTLSQARRIVPVVTKANHEQWIKKAKTLPQKDLEREVTAINPKAKVKEKIRPLSLKVSELRAVVDRETEENLRALQDLLSQKLGKAATVADVIAWAAKVTRQKFDPVKRAERSRSVSLGKSPKMGRHPIPLSVKHPVVKRDDWRCTYVSEDGRRCEEKRWLALHHVREVARGGLNTVDNLRILCRSHHKLVHASS